MQLQTIFAVLDEAEDLDKVDYYDKSLPIHLNLEEEPYDDSNIGSDEEDDHDLDEIVMQDLLNESNKEISPLQ
ncbi:hypothetical protein C0992_008365 [Termitomyces sp. T32_za158]|nr:hypothetical protein C0992_008365 [Termitomyces sp. T32_za158]